MSYATPAELKNTLGIGDSQDDTEVQRALDAASRLVDDYTSRSFNVVDTAVDTDKSARLFTPKGPRLLIIDDAAAIDTVEVDSGGWTVVDAADWLAEPANADTEGGVFTRLFGSWPGARQSVRVTAWFGWPALPETVTQAVILQASKILKSAKEAPFGVAPLPSIDGGGIRMMNKLHADAELMLSGFRRSKVASPGVITIG